MSHIIIIVGTQTRFQVKSVSNLHHWLVPCDASVSALHHHDSKALKSVCVRILLINTRIQDISLPSLTLVLL